MITNGAGCAHEIKFRIVIVTAVFNNKFTSNWTYIEGRNI
jgi:hypothetical protein